MRWVRRKERYTLTWAGRLVVLALTAGLVGIGLLRWYPFLAVNRPVNGDWIVVEGWVPDHTLQKLLDLYASGAYTRVIAAGGPIEYGAALYEYETLARVTAVRLLHLGLAPETVHAVPAPYAVRDRTLASARAVRAFLEERGETEPALDVLTSGPHARRSLLLYRRAFGPRARIGVIAVDPASFDRTSWWKSSEGVRSMLGETMAWLYARCWPQQGSPEAISTP